MEGIFNGTFRKICKFGAVLIGHSCVWTLCPLTETMQPVEFLPAAQDYQPGGKLRKASNNSENA